MCEGVFCGIRNYVFWEFLCGYWVGFFERWDLWIVVCGVFKWWGWWGLWRIGRFFRGLVFCIRWVCVGGVLGGGWVWLGFEWLFFFFRLFIVFLCRILRIRCWWCFIVIWRGLLWSGLFCGGEMEWSLVVGGMGKNGRGSVGV